MPKISMIRGDTRIITATFVDSEGNPVNLTGGLVHFTANQNKSPSDDTSAAITKNISSFAAPTTGVQDITLTSADTNNLAAGTYYYDIQFVSSTGVVISLPQDILLIKPDISRRTS